MNKHNRWMIMGVTMLLAVSLSACSGDNKETAPAANNGSSQNTPAPAEQPAEQPDEQAGEDTVLQGSGIYNGQQDSHSIEIETEDGPNTYEIAEGMEEVLTELSEGDKVKFEYTELTVQGSESVKQRQLTKLWKDSETGSAGGKAGAGAATGSADSGQAASLPAEQTFELEMEGMTESRTAKLAEADGYSLYVFDGFTFKPEEDRLVMDIDNDYYVDITKLPSDYNLDELRREATADLKENGDVRELTGDEIHPAMRDASLFLMSSSDNLTREMIVKEVDGQGYIFHVNMPHEEASAGFGTLAFTSLDSLVSS
ncbi:hypothetical protein DNH61_08755 [Paenibacillus sambharensis]|uniref:Uncharacterized protein n=1 Tax=Paenibacillus sambharensis TaxID=1803190 RepID=A0A2W1LC43_9BACL|nr:hypothetical protein [Paenibacillus sambharensis]PZD96279.1 hypothetical protein DNH61_08755 [Paenibacillus sambharensis]